MNNTVIVALAQLDLVVGDVKGNTARILESAEKPVTNCTPTWPFSPS